MGIPQFKKYLSNSPLFKYIFMRRYKYADVLCVDANSIIYGLHDKTNYQKMLLEMKDVVQRMIERSGLKEGGVILFAIDGVVPQSKMNQQRMRRFNKKIKEDEFNTNAISPGTKYMFEVHENVFLPLFDSMSDKYNIVYSSHLSRGEGEHKIAETLRMLGDHEKKVVAVYGLDADLILIYSQILETYKYKEIFIVFDDQKYISLSVFNDILKNLYKATKYYDFDRTLSSPVSDFSVLMMFFGNDFLPKMTFCLNGQRSLDTLIYGYYKFLNNPQYDKPKVLTLDHIIMNDNLKEFCKFIIDNKYEETLIAGITVDPKINILTYPMMNFFKSETLGSARQQQFSVNMEEYDQQWFDYMVSPTSNRKACIATQTDIDNICNAYLNGMHWVQTYYITGKVNEGWYYPSYYAPNIHSLYNYLEKNSETFVCESCVTVGNRKVTPVEQLCMIIPKSSIQIINTDMKHLFSKLELQDLYVTSFEIERNGKPQRLETEEAKHEELALIPFPDRNDVINVIDDDELKEKYYSRYEEADVYYFDRILFRKNKQ